MPVVLNFYGGAFVFFAHGADEPFCRHVAERTAYIVLDASYALAPEYPFPAAVEDAEDLIAYVLGRPEEYDARNIVLSGFSSGGNIALAASCNSPQSTLGKDAVRAVLAFYPPTNMTVASGDKRALDGATPSPPALLKTIMSAFRSSYLPPGVDPADPRISVINADPSGFPDHVMIVTASKDRLAPEAEALAGRIEAAGKNVVVKRFEGATHGFDKTREKDGEDAKLRDEAYDLAIEFLEDIKQ
jgi:acetyl esterase/lipase